MIQFVDPDDRDLLLVLEGDRYVSPAGRSYPIIDGIPRFVAGRDRAQAQTAASFGYKWTKQAHWGFKPGHDEVIWNFWREIFRWEGPQDLRELMEGKIVLDAGCGSGASLNQFVRWPAVVVGVDISSAIDTCRKNFEGQPNLALAQADVTRLPFPDESFDVVWSHGVLHHTPDTFESLKSVARHARVDGLVIFYVYVRKAPIREFADDHIRSIVSPLPPEEAWRRMEALTEFSRSLAGIKVELTVERDVPELGIKRGRYPLQRFLYYNFLKCYWNDDLSFDDNVHVNFDWYHPAYAHRHSAEEVREWLATLDLRQEHMHVSDSGIAVVARKRRPRTGRAGHIGVARPAGAD
ncbi:MAG: methyltransferase domain-containing protein [Acidobacteriota bacterium]